MSKHPEISLSVENERADAGRDGRTRLASLYSQARTQPYSVDPKFAQCAHHAYRHAVSKKEALLVLRFWEGKKKKKKKVEEHLVSGGSSFLFFFTSVYIYINLDRNIYLYYTYIIFSDSQILDRKAFLSLTYVNCVLELLISSFACM